VAEQVRHDHPMVVMHAVDQVGPLTLRTENPVGLGERVRLEQERIDWEWVEERMR